MEGLLSVIQQELRQKLGGFRDCDIYITPDLLFLPQGVKMPCVGIKDGKTSHTYLAGEEKEFVMTVRLVVFFELTRKESALVGTARERGILQTNKEIIAILENNLLGIPGMGEARITDDPESKFYLGPKKELFQRKELGLQYTRVTG